MHKSNELPTYNAEISAGSLMIRESRVIAKLLLEGADEKKWYEAIFVKNLLQKKSPATAKRQTRLIRNRLELMSQELWRMVVDGTKEVAIQVLLAASIKHSKLLRDFMDKVIRLHYKTFNNQLTAREWETYLNECEHRDPSVSKWSESTRKKLGQVVFRILSEAKYIDNTRSLKLIPVRVVPEVSRYLRNSNEDYVLRCMEVSK